MTIVKLLPDVEFKRMVKRVFLTIAKKTTAPKKKSNLGEKESQMEHGSFPVEKTETSQNMSSVPSSTDFRFYWSTLRFVA